MDARDFIHEVLSVWLICCAQAQSEANNQHIQTGYLKFLLLIIDKKKELLRIG